MPRTKKKRRIQSHGPILPPKTSIHPMTDLMKLLDMSVIKMKYLKYVNEKDYVPNVD
jgi:hypothetical protein